MGSTFVHHVYYHHRETSEHLKRKRLPARSLNEFGDVHILCPGISSQRYDEAGHFNFLAVFAGGAFIFYILCKFVAQIAGDPGFHQQLSGRFFTATLYVSNKFDAIA